MLRMLLQLLKYHIQIIVMSIEFTYNQIQITMLI